MKVAITGAKGQLAREIIEIIKSGKSEIGQIPNEYINCNLVCADVEELDITDEEAVERFIQAERPDILINCAAMTNVDGCETALETAMKVNAIGPRNLSRSCKKVNAKIVHISTDCLFIDNNTFLCLCHLDPYFREFVSLSVHSHHGGFLGTRHSRLHIPPLGRFRRGIATSLR